MKLESVSFDVGVKFVLRAEDEIDTALFGCVSSNSGEANFEDDDGELLALTFGVSV